MVEPVNDNILNLVNELYNNIDAKDKIINDQALEIARLKENKKKVIEFINTWEKYKKENKPLEVTLLDLLYIKEILGDKENEK